MDNKTINVPYVSVPGPHTVEVLIAYGTIVACQDSQTQEIWVLPGQPQSQATAGHLYKFLNTDRKGYLAKQKAGEINELIYE